ncbi:hypothetical protein WS90_35290 [Burkholderia cepacia]|uniref:Uncharacterized protein n=1 Tax=Burkholderia cepacia TaxID=292 RepID=A0A103Z2I1_BURCE|nr:hypothetical protein WS90_35290 [Burkholderia cepacia]
MIVELQAALFLVGRKHSLLTKLVGQGPSAERREPTVLELNTYLVDLPSWGKVTIALFLCGALPVERSQSKRRSSRIGEPDK